MKRPFQLLVLVSLAMGPGVEPGVSAADSADAFARGTNAYMRGDYVESVRGFSAAAAQRPAPGTFQNLGNAEWSRGRIGHAILAWERALWLNGFNQSARGNLAFARKTAQLESPDLRWYEVVSTWLPVNWWAWIAGASLWLAIAFVMLPGILRWRKLTWHQALAALGLMIFLLSLPALLGVHTRSRIGFVLRKDTPLRLTPTLASQNLTRLSPRRTRTA